MDGDPRAELLIGELGSAEMFRRVHARQELVALGRRSTPALVHALEGESDRLRWEACKALAAIRDPSAAAPLVEALRDEVMGVRWVAAEALIALGRAAEAPLLRALEEHFDSVYLREAAHHVLNGLKQRGWLSSSTRALLPLLAGSGPRMQVGMEARRALSALGVRLH